jgi:hypothetical protein
MLQFLNVLFLAVHTFWILFVCLGWIWKRTRFWHLVAVALTALSWFGLGIWYGWGFCLCTHWHWQVREQLGCPDDSSYTHLVMVELTGIDVSPETADFVTAGAFALAALLTITLNVRGFLHRRRRRIATFSQY